MISLSNYFDSLCRSRCTAPLWIQPWAQASTFSWGVSRARICIIVFVNYVCLHDLCGSFAEICGDCNFPHVKGPTSISEICGDDESAQKPHRKISKSWLAQFPTLSWAHSGTSSRRARRLPRSTSTVPLIIAFLRGAQYGQSRYRELLNPIDF